MLTPSMATKVPVQSAPKPLQVFSYLVILYLKFDRICPADIRDILLSNCEQAIMTNKETDGLGTTDHCHTYTSGDILLR